MSVRFGVVDSTSSRSDRLANHQILLPQICDDLLNNRFNRQELEDRGITPSVVQNIADYFYNAVISKSQLTIEAVKEALKFFRLEARNR